MDYPVIFRCAECTLEHDSLEPLVSHIWNRHLGNFPFNCALCNYPALNPDSLNAHYAETHHDRVVEFKRKIDDESRLFEILVQSIVVPLYDVDDDPTNEESAMYEDSAEMALDHLEMAPELQSDVHHVMANQHHDIRDHQNNEQWDSAPALKREHDVRISPGPGIMYYAEVEDEDSQGTSMQIREEDDGRVRRSMRNAIEKSRLHENEMPSAGDGEEVVHDDMIERFESGAEESAAYEVYEAEDEIEYVDGDEDIQYVDQDGNPLFISGPVIESKSMGPNKVQLRLMKNQHVEYIVDKVASGLPKRNSRPSTTFECEICGKIIKHPCRIREHLLMHEGIRRFSCELCHQSFTQKSALNVHRRLHTGEQPFTCSWDCGKKFHSSSACRMHERTHSGAKKFHCDICGQLFAKRFHLQRHEKLRHSHIYNPPAEDEEAQSEDTPVDDAAKLVVDEVIEEVRQEVQLKKRSMQRGRKTFCDGRSLSPCIE